jgi:enamidase
MKVAIFNIAKILSGDIAAPVMSGDTIVTDNGKIISIGSGDTPDCDVAIDADGMMAMPGLIDSHVHITFGDYTPRQKTVGFLESYIHGGVTTCISASEVHVPGRPRDPAGVKALAIAARKSFEHYRPGGMRVHAGSVILEPNLTDADFAELANQGVWLAKAGFGAFATPYDYAPYVAMARQHGMVSMVHTGGSSIPGSTGIWADHVLKIQPDVSYHVNGGPIAMPDADFPRLVNESRIAMQVCTAGNLRTALLVAKLLKAADQEERLLIATDTPTGTGGDGDRQQRQGLSAQQRRARAWPRRRHRPGRRLPWRLAERCPVGAPKRRHHGGRRGVHRRRAAFCRQEPQYAGDREEGKSSALARATELFR